ncbi:uncharacterized protein LOC141685403 [Apium graveolens]|uniref:uncharacterized protein LOC141685403 n=1 Tax=Apium graveolens TaxID=4045 RepID=UPI003D7930D0
MVKTDEVCQVFGINKETTSHCFIHCMFTKSCWHIVCPEAKFDSVMNLPTWFLYVLEYHKEKATTISMVCWSIWRTRNDVVWNNKNWRASNVVTSVIAYLTQWKDAQKLGKAVSPKPGHLTVRNDKGEMLFAARSCFPGKPKVHHAEAIGIREALSWIKVEIDKNEETTACSLQHRMIVESDCQVAVKAVLKKERICSPFGGVIDECKSILESYNNKDIVFVKRSGNKAAYWLASSSSSSPGCICRGEYVPSDLIRILENDLN